MGPAESYLDVLKLGADNSSVAENQFRNQLAVRIKELEKQRSFAFRRLNLKKEVSGVIAGAESEEIAAEAIEAIKIDFEQLPHVTDPLESLFPGGPNARCHRGDSGLTVPARRRQSQARPASGASSASTAPSISP